MKKIIISLKLTISGLHDLFWSDVNKLSIKLDSPLIYSSLAGELMRGNTSYIRRDSPALSANIKHSFVLGKKSQDLTIPPKLPQFP